MLTTNVKKQLVRLPLDQIADAEATQIRLKLNKDIIENYADSMIDGVEFPPIIVFYDGEFYWLADGFHRFAATALVNGGFETGDILAEVRDGTLRDAIAYALSANSVHGLPRNNKDRRRAVGMALSDSEWQQWSNKAIAKLCNVSEFLVRQVREELCPRQGDEPLVRKFITKHGSEAVMTIEPKAKAVQAHTHVPSAQSNDVCSNETSSIPEDELKVSIRKNGLIPGLYITYGWDSVIVPFEKVAELADYIERYQLSVIGLTA